MARARRVSGLSGLQQAFDEVRFGATRTLNLRAELPTPSDAAQRIENWLRQHQVQQSGDTLIITGRGNNSVGGVSVVREAAIRVFHELRRKGIVEDFLEHTPGSFVVTLAPVTAMFDAAKRRREHTPLPPPVPPPTLSALDVSTQSLLRLLAVRSLAALGVREPEAFVTGEMLRLFGVLAATIGAGADRDHRLRLAIAAAMSEDD